MPDNNITIKFKASGAPKLKAAIKALADEQDRLNNKYKDYVKKNKKVVKNNRLLDNSFATLRSQLLLFSFAMSMGIRQLIGFAKEAAKVESMERAFTTLSGGVEDGAIAMEKLKEATNGTMSEFDLFQQANNAMILGVTKNSDEMAEMFDVAQRLGRALGRDTKSSVESLITGIGRQSRLMLDNIGIIVAAEDAYKSFAEGIDTTADKLSDAQKKQAFLVATMESARKKVDKLGDETLSTQDAFDMLTASSANLSVTLGKNVRFTALLALGFSKIMDDSSEWSSALENAMAQSTSQAKVVILLLKLANAWTDKTFKAEISRIEKQEEAAKKNKKALEMEIATRKASIKWLLAEKKALRERQVLIQESDERVDDWYEKMAKFPKFEGFDIHEDARFFIEGLETQEQAIARFRKKQEKRQAIHDAVILESKARSVSGMIGALGQLNDAVEGSSKVSARMAQISATIDALAGANKAFAQGGVFGFITGAAILAAGAANVVNIEKNIGKFEQGGMVGGRRHSQGGTMIEAEQGEFVMSRNAVNAVGVEAMNRINAGGGAGAVNINFTGNVMSQDFIEDEAIPMIKEAIRRGADIGVA